MRIEAWNLASSAEMAHLYRAEHRRFLSVLGWETTATWTTLEPARAAGHLPGLVARDASGAVRGWTFYVRRGGELQVGGFTSAPDACAPLVDRLLADAAVLAPVAVRVFGYTDAPGLAEALAARGFSVGGYDYWTAPLAVAPPPAEVRPWRAGDLWATAELLRAAYPRRDDVLRPFGGDGPEAWVDYVVGLTATTGCGAFAPDLSVVVPGTAGTLAAVALVSRLGPAMAHLAQMAVHPEAARRGLGARVLTAAMRGAAAQGLPAISLLVAADNQPARRLYRGHGFAATASFLTAWTPAARQPRRSTSVAWLSGGVSTRR
jgi:ribosomal protein S18 acetylase RimI-like enzyme